MAIIECARNLGDIPDAHSAEFRPDHKNNVVDLMSGQEDRLETGGSMRLGSYPAHLQKGSKIASIYQSTEISERHRHRYEVMNHFIPILEKCGMQISGKNPELDLVETIERADHPWFIACQFHPELKSKPLLPHPLFASYIHAAYEHRNFRLGQERRQTEKVRTSHG